MGSINPERSFLKHVEPFGSVVCFLTDNVPQGMEGIDIQPCYHAGIEIRPESPDLRDAIERSYSELEKDQDYVSASLLYLTSYPLSIDGPTGEPAKPMVIGHPAEMAVSFSLRQYAVSGPNKLGTLLSLAHGIRTFSNAQEKLGLHAAIIFDRGRNGAILIAGKSGIGKTTHSLLLEKFAPSRFQVLGDDWAEIDVENKTAGSISTSFGVAHDTLASYLLQTGPFMKIASSFGKDFYTRTDGAIRGYDFRILKFITLMEPGSTTDETAFWRDNYHIPFSNVRFLDSDLSDSKIEQNNVFQEIQARKRNLWRNAITLRNHCQHLFLEKTGGIDQIHKKIVDFIQ